ncbi:unnamed protein product, partial [Didymodactylos carnosus]
MAPEPWLYPTLLLCPTYDVIHQAIEQSCDGITCYYCTGCGDPFDKTTYGSSLNNASGSSAACS